MLRLSIVLLTLLFAMDARADRCERAEAMLLEAVRIRGLAEKSPVQCRELQQQEYFDEIIALIKRDVAQPRLEVEERLFKILGLVPESYPYANCLIKSYAHEAAAFYSPVAKSFVMPEWIPASDLVLIHEATHALQDQHFDLDAIARSPTVVGNRAMAVGALIEGDAMEVEADFKAQLSGEAPADIDDTYQVHPEPHCKLPGALENLFYFVYEYGEQFIRKLRGRYSRDHLFRHPPTTTSEILHPETYGTAPKKFKAPFPSPVLSQQPLKLLYSERLGEFVIRILLGQYIEPKEAGIVAYGWTGDRLAFYVDRATGVELVAWRIEFDSAAKLDRFIAAANQWLSKRFNFAVPDVSASYVAGTGSGAVVAMERKGNGLILTIRP